MYSNLVILVSLIEYEIPQFVTQHNGQICSNKLDPSSPILLC